MSTGPARIVVVDDSLTVRMDLAEALSAAGFETCPCRDAAEARQALAEAPCALLVLDVVLPDADGVELLAELRGAPATAGLPVILLSSLDEVADRVRGLATGANAYLGKPYDAATLVRRARALILGRERRSSDAPLVLFVDDSATVRESFGALLREAGYEVLLAEDGERGLELAADLRPDALVIDYELPGIDGVEVIRRLRLDPGLSTTACLLLTGSDGGGVEVAALEAGADTYARKGDAPRAVLSRLEAMLRAARGSRSRSTSGASSHAALKLLAVDDSVTYLDALDEHLRGDGYEVIRAHSGEQALALLAVERVDAILLDVVMPGIGGLEACRRIKASLALRDIPLIILTGRDEGTRLVESIDAGADDFVTKSGEFDVLRARLRAQLRRKHFEDENRHVTGQLLRQEAETHAAQALAEAREALLVELEAKNAELELLNRELRAFAYSVSHDLRAPLRVIDGFGRELVERAGDALDERGRHFVARMRAASARMNTMIEGLLMLSRVTQRELARRPVRLDEVAARIVQGLRELEPAREVVFVCPDALVAEADPELIEPLLENLLGNAWKFTAARRPARIELGHPSAVGGERVYVVRDNGAGFDMTYAAKLFAPFQRLHAERDFAGTGIGLATVQRIVHRHGGRIWAEAAPDQGAAFYFTLARPALEAAR